MSVFTLVTITSSLMIAPVLSKISKDIGVTDDSETQLALSIFVLAYAFGPLIFAPLSEVYGRRPIMLLASVFYLLWNTIAGSARSEGLLIAARFLSGVGASASFGIGAGVIHDCWLPEQRGVGLAINGFLPLLGPAIGPLIGGYMATVTTWHWIFWALSIVDGFFLIIATIFFRESHGPTILHKKAKRLRKETGNLSLYTTHERQKGWRILTRRLTLSFRLLILHPVIQCSALYSAVSFGRLYAVLSSYPTLWQTIYGQNTGQTGLNYISAALGESVGSLLGAFFIDRIYAHFSKPKSPKSRLFTRKSSTTATPVSELLEPRKPTPEHRILLVIPGMLPMPIGLIWLGWSAQAYLHWIMPNIGTFLFGVGASMGSVGISVYIVDGFGEYSASAMAASRTISFASGFAFPLFILQLFQKLGWGGGMTLLAGLVFCVGVAMPAVIWTWGSKLRAKGLYVGEI